MGSARRIAVDMLKYKMLLNSESKNMPVSIQVKDNIQYSSLLNYRIFYISSFPKAKKLKNLSCTTFHKNDLLSTQRFGTNSMHHLM